MLVLTRKIGQAIQVPEYGVIIRVLSIHHDRVHLGITAPVTVRILRGELLEGLTQGTAEETKSARGEGGDAHRDSDGMRISSATRLAALAPFRFAASAYNPGKR